MSVLIAFLIVGILGLLLGLGLAIADKKFAVEKDEKLIALEESMPGANCGGCGYAGCQAYAEAVYKGEAKPGLCSPGGDQLARKMCEILGIQVEDVEKKILEAHKAATEKVEKEIENRYPNATKTSTGLRYIVLKEGSGADSPKMGQSVTVHYQGELLNGKVFDSSLIREKPATFRVGQVIDGWNEALQSMKKGEKRLLIIPPELGYGEYGYPGVIPPDSYLIFNVELLDF